jgi:uncharacterized protein (TIGR02466 family)
MAGAVKSELTFIFPTLVLERKLDGTAELDRRLTARILEREGATQGVTRSNVGGWHSAPDFMRWGGSEPQELFQLVVAGVRDYVAAERKLEPAAFELTLSAEAWANVARAGSYAKPHVHPNSNLSAVYYVAAGDAPEASPSGVIEFLDPRGRPNMFVTEGTLSLDAYRVTPQSGLLLMFPSWLYHYVHPYQGTTPRICVAFNLTLQKLSVDAARRSPR